MENLEDFKGMSFDQQNFSKFEGTKAHELATLIGSAYSLPAARLFIDRDRLQRLVFSG
ncbi:hypothetical protein [Chamaesiphon sp. OTE_75_metabat_556]|uniref:hypothetical protein n=1 Tax=Chamaesiphon sp. OTE_75_metabat_556 TaxID=2964692 RepID=UPI00286C4F8D|nr:hypothetical protein [Chamaesiphon sp. OTE_75_metabat_556]